MKRVAIAVILVALLGVAACGDEASPRNTRAYAGLDPAMAAWTWRKERASAEWCSEHQTGPRFTAQLKSVGDGQPSPKVHYQSKTLGFARTRISIRDGAQEAFSWLGSRASVWHVVDHYIYLVDFNSITPGGDLVAADLDTGRLLWKIELAGAFLGTNSLWSNQKVIQVANDRIYVWSEDGGRYLEIRERHGAEVVAVRKFED